MKPSAETIVALSTPKGYSGIGVIRMSGPDAIALLEKIFRPSKPLRDFPDRLAVYGKVIDPTSGKVLDDGIALVMRGPASYTGEDVVELSLHGSPTVLDAVEHLVVRLGARPATRGEFTRRAFISGKLDLVQAEAVIDLIEATSTTGAEEARERLDGSLSLEIQEISDSLKDIVAELEAHIDFDEDDREPAPQPYPLIRNAVAKMDAVMRNAQKGRIRKEGIRAAIVGKPNVGKSTLFNALLRKERAIVTPFAGTTRDTLDDAVLIGSARFVLFDTAGIRENPEPVEEEGIRRTQRAIDEADLTIAVIDGSSPLRPEDLQVLDACRESHALVVVNKKDLGIVVAPESQSLGPTDRPRVAVSAKTGDGLDDLEELMGRMGETMMGLGELGSRPSVNERGALLIEAARLPLLKLLESAEQGIELEPEILSLEVSRALEPLEEMTGERADEGILDRIFERFCVGK